jgi:ribonuclease BN (tRNA processing enzyme)
MRVKILGCGDAFGSGGRLNACFLVDEGARSFLIDCGATVMVSIRRFGVDPNAVAAIVLSHLHGDHFGGLPSFILDAQLVSRRTAPLTILGPRGTGARLNALMEVLYPGSTSIERRFPIEVVEIDTGSPVPTPIVGATIRALDVKHESGAPSLGLRIECNGCVIAYSGDTEWTDALLDIGRNADIFLAESSFFERKVPGHMDFMTLRERLPAIAAKRTVLTHMSPDMLSRSPAAFGGCFLAEDGMAIELA